VSPMAGIELSGEVADGCEDGIGVPIGERHMAADTLIIEMQALLTGAISHTPTPQRRQYLLSPILFPVPGTSPPAHSAGTAIQTRR
jgi:hypothetical protein